MRQNVALAVGVVVFLLASVLAGRVHLASGMAVHEASILAVTLNGMRLLRQPRGSWRAGRRFENGRPNRRQVEP